MTIKPVLSQKSGKHDKKDSQDGQQQQISGPSGRQRGCLNQISTPKSPSPQREQKPQSRSSVYDGGRRRRSPHRTNRNNKRENVARERGEKVTCKSPPYQSDTNAPCSSQQQQQYNSGSCKSPKANHGTSSSGASSSASNSNNNNVNSLLDDALSGYNSGDEHIGQKDSSLPLDEWNHRDETFQKAMSERGFMVNEIAEDGACLFRSISLQIYGDQDMHEVIRQQTMDYIYKNREYFAQFVTEDINAYVKRKRENHVHGNHIEIQAISEIYNRAVELYCYKTEPINIFNSDQLKNGYEPLRLSYQRGSHYNAILNPYKASVGVGLGLAGYRPDEPPELKQMRDAVRLSEDLEIEQTMFEDKLKTTDWEATNEVMEEQIARESYLQWCRDNMQKQPQKAMNASSSTVTSSDLSGNKSPSCSDESSFESEDYTPYPSDTDERCDFGESSSATAAAALQPNDATNTIYYVQQQRQRRRKRRRGIAQSTVAGPSSYSTPNVAEASGAASAPVAAAAVASDYKHSSPKLVKLGRRSIMQPDELPDKSSMPGTSKQNVTNDRPMSAFYHSLLESSYSKDNSEIVANQLTEEEMIRKALQMSRMDFMQKLHSRADSDPPSP